MMLSNRLKMVAREEKPPQIVGTETAASTVTVNTLNVPIPSGDEGDLLLLITHRHTSSFAEPTGWHQDVSLGPSPVGPSLQAFLREADGTEGGVVSIQGSVTDSRLSAGIIYRFRGWSVPGTPNTHQSTCNSPLPTVEATAPSVVICAVARAGDRSGLQTIPAGYAEDMAVASNNARFVAISNPSAPKGLISPGSLTYEADIDCFALTYAIPGK